jgi:hypothetical protein
MGKIQIYNDTEKKWVAVPSSEKLLFISGDYMSEWYDLRNSQSQ